MKHNCIVCAADVENWDVYPNKTVVHPIGGTTFRTYGHYGSSVFDPMDGSYLEIVICDECLSARMAYAYEGGNTKQSVNQEMKMDKKVASLREIRETLADAQLRYEAENDAWWNSLTEREREDAFYAVCKRIYQAECIDRGTYRHALYNVFRFDEGMYGQGMHCGFMELHNCIYPDRKE